MTASFGIDHPLIAVHDIDLLRERLVSLGFTMTPVGRHPWGTSTSLAMFEGCLLEIVGIYDDTLLDMLPAGDFRFGRHVHAHLMAREGIALTALHSTDSVRDADHAAACGFDVAGHLEFGRDVVLPDGRADRTKTTLALLPDDEWPRLSFFLCQQHRPELIYVPEWLDHPNTVHGIAGVTVLAEGAHQPALHERLRRLYGSPAMADGGFDVPTANGMIGVRTAAAIEAEYGPLPATVLQSTTPCIVGMDFLCRDFDKLERFVRQSGLDHDADDRGITLGEPSLTGNTIMRFLT